MQRATFLRQLLTWPVALGLAGAGVPGWTPVLAAQPSQSVRRRLRFTLTFTNASDRALAAQTFWCYLPAFVKGSQEPDRPVVSMAHDVMDDPVGHRVLKLSFDEFPAYGRKVVTVSVDVDLGDRPSVLSDAQRASWLQAERFIESDDPRMVALATELRQERPERTARAIFEWVGRYMSYSGYVAQDMGALHALVHRSGDCTEYANLVVAIARAAGIPARMVGGYVVDRDLAVRPPDYHNWAEVCLDGHWRLVDAQKGNFLVSSERYVAFRIYRDVALSPIGLAHRYHMDGKLQVALGS